MAAPVTITVSGQKKVLAELAAALGPKLTAKAVIGLRESALLVEATAKAGVAPHHWRGTTEAGIHAHNTTIMPDGSVTVDVGTKSPQARALEAGWFSSGGMQPPADALEAWATSRGIAPQTGQSTKGMAFVMARAIGGASTGNAPARRYGYAMGALHYLKKSVARKNKAAILAILIRALKV